MLCHTKNQEGATTAGTKGIQLNELCHTKNQAVSFKKDDGQLLDRQSFEVYYHQVAT